MVNAIIIFAVTALLLILTTFLCPKIKLGKIHLSTYWIVTLFGAGLMVCCSLISFPEIGAGLSADTSVNPLKIIVIFFSMTFLSIFLDEMGLFSYLAYQASKRAKTSQLKLFFITYFLVSLLTVFTSNDIVILTFTPFICYFAKRSKIDPLPFLIMEFVAANTWSMLLLIGNPTNIYLATSLSIDFLSYFTKMALPSLFAGAVELVIMLLLFKKKLSQPLSYDEQKVTIKNRLGMWLGVICLIGCLILLVLSNYLQIEMWIITLSSMGLLLISAFILSFFRKETFSSLGKTFLRLPYQLIPFILGMFVLVLALDKNGVVEGLSNLLASGTPILTFGASSFLFANLINNIPMSVLYSYALNRYGIYASDTLLLQATYATIISSNIGAFLTPLGALAGLMFTDLVSKQDIHLSFLTFSKYGLIIAIPTLFAAYLGLFIMVH